ncbi:hypothetical protein [Maribacter arcticus]|uniref:glucosamine inositolphosphorylceramide transferase family protein n=1 Tax=Maribacter arcticus TaxID=561365 RepID=UPI0030020D3B
MRIGIYIKEFERLENWELRILHGLQIDANLEVCLLIQENGNSGNTVEEDEREFGNSYSANQGFAAMVLNLQLRLERKFFFKKINTVDKEKLLPYLKSCPILKINLQVGNRDTSIRNGDVEKIKSFDLDVLLHLSDRFLRVEMGTLAKHGLWSLSHVKDYINHKGYIGLREICARKAAISVALHQFNGGSTGTFTLDKAYLSHHWSLIKTKDFVLEGSVSLLLKNLRVLDNGIKLGCKEENNKQALASSFQLKDVLTYGFRFYGALVRKTVKGASNFLFGTNYQRWTLFLGKGDFLQAELSQLRPAQLPKNEFWADPFLFRFKNTCYVFFETYDYKTKKGKLSCGKIENNEVIDVVDILDLEYHLSYPYVFEEDGEIFLMPETMDNKRLEIYKCIQFPNKWELFTTAFEGEMVADASFYNDILGQKWLFVNKKEMKSLPLNSELYIYKVDSAKLNTLESHIQNPVIIDSRTGRNGGAVFNFGNEIFRPSQRNVDGIYGRALNINKIKELTIRSYVEEISEIVEPTFQEGLMSIHHMHQIEGMFVFDAAFEK